MNRRNILKIVAGAICGAIGFKHAKEPIKVPVGNSAPKPNPTNGTLMANLDEGIIRMYRDGEWVPVEVEAITGTMVITGTFKDDAT